MLEPTSTVHEVVKAIVTAIRGVTDPGKVRVFDGLPGQFPETRGLIVIGIAPGDTVPIVVEPTPVGLGDRSDEDITVRGWLSVQDPATNEFEGLRGEAVDLLNAIAESVRTDPTLGGVCDFAAVSTRVAYYQSRTTETAVVDVTFEVHAKAYL